MGSHHTRWDTPEEALAAFLGSGAPDAIRVLFDMTAPTLFRVALAAAPDAPTAEDILQETYVTFLDKLDEFESGRPVMPWLLGILRISIKRAGRAAARRPNPDRLALREFDEAPVPDSDACVARTTIEALDEPYRSVALLHFIYGLEPSEIAHVRGDPPGTVRSQLHRARERLGRKLRVSSALLLFGPPSRSLSLIRTEVVAHAQTLSLTAPAVVGGVLVVKKLTSIGAVALAVLLLVVGGGLWWSLQDEGPEAVDTAALLDGTVKARAPELDPEGEPGTTPAAAKPPTLPDGPYVTGRVVTREDRPVAGARIAALPSTIGVARSPWDATYPQSTSNAAGEFVVALHEEAPVFFLYVEADTYAPRMAQIVRDRDEVRVVLGAATSVEGQVRNRDSEPVEGATVTVGVMIGGAWREWTGISTAAGSYRVEGLPAAVVAGPEGTRVGGFLRVDAPGYASTTRMYITTVGPGETEVVDLYVSRGVDVRGRVVLAGGETPVAGARVVLGDAGMSRMQMKVGGHEIEVPRLVGTSDETTTDAEGRFRFANAPVSSGSTMPGHARAALFAWGPGTCLGRTSIATGRDEGTLDVLITVQPSAEVVGQLVDEQGDPVAGVRVHVKTEGLDTVRGMRFHPDVPKQGATTGPDGRFRITGARAYAGRSAPATLSAGQRAGVGRKYQRGVEHAFDLEAGKRHDLGTLTFAVDGLTPEERARLSSIRVVDEAGAPIWGATLGHSYANQVLKTDRQGFTSIVWGGSGNDITSVKMLARASGFATRHVDVPLPTEGEFVVEMTRTLGSIRGVVLDTHSNPLPGVWVEAAPGDIPEAEAYPETRDSPQSPRCVLGYDVTDRDGRFRIQALPPGTYRVRARINSWAQVRSGSQVILPDIETSGDPLEIRLKTTKQAEGVDVTFRVVDEATGRAALGVTGTLHARGQTLGSPVATPGRVRFTGVRPGEAVVTIRAPRYAEVRETIIVGDRAPEEVVVRVRPGATLRGRATFPPSVTQRASWRLWLKPESGASRFGTEYRPLIKADGTYETSMLGPGRYYLLAHATRRADGQMYNLVPRKPRLVIPESGDVERDFELVEPGTLSLILGDARLPPAPWQQGFVPPARRAFGDGARAELHDADGELVMSQQGLAIGYAGWLGRMALPPGTYRLRIEYPGEEPKEEDLEIEAGKTTTVTPDA